MDSKDKQDQVARYLKGAKRIRSRDERRLIAENTRARKQDRRTASPRRQDWSDWDGDEQGDEDLFEHMRPAARTDLSGARSAPAPDLSGRHLGLDRGLLIAPRGPRATVLAGGVEVDVQVKTWLRQPGALAVGDEVYLEAISPEAMAAVGRVERKSVLTRRDPSSPRHELVIAANVDVGVIVLAAGGRRLKIGLVDRLWIALARGGIDPVVVVNKIDLAADAEQRADIDGALEGWRSLGLDAVGTSAVGTAGIDELRECLVGKTAVFVGQSGVGKSSLLNELDPDGARRVEVIRDADGRGRHTTTASTLRELVGGTRLIDTPGIRAFGLPEIEVEDVMAAFGDLAALARCCRFRDCRHAGEDGCTVAAAAEEDPLVALRLEALRQILASLEEDR